MCNEYWTPSSTAAPSLPQQPAAHCVTSPLLYNSTATMRQHLLPQVSAFCGLGICARTTTTLSETLHRFLQDLTLYPIHFLRIWFFAKSFSVVIKSLDAVQSAVVPLDRPALWAVRDATCLALAASPACSPTSGAPGPCLCIISTYGSFA